MVAPYTSSSAACLVTVPTPTSESRIATAPRDPHHHAAQRDAHRDLKEGPRKTTYLFDG